MSRKGPEETFSDDGDALHLDRGVAYRGVHVIKTH